MRLIIALTALFLLVGCAPITPVPFVGPSGNEAYSMKCSGAGRTMEMCYQKAGEVCPVGYSIVGSSSETMIMPMNDSFVAVPKRGLAIECKASDG